MPGKVAKAMRMSRTIKAIYGNGVFRPIEPVSLIEGQPVDITLPERREFLSSRALLQSLLEVAAIPEEPPEDGLSAVDHDKILYAPEDGPA